MLYIFEVTCESEGQFQHCIYVTTFDGVWMLANILDHSENVIHFQVNENRTHVPSIKFNAESLRKWK